MAGIDTHSVAVTVESTQYHAGDAAHSDETASDHSAAGLGARGGAPRQHTVRLSLALVPGAAATGPASAVATAVDAAVRRFNGRHFASRLHSALHPPETCCMPLALGSSSSSLSSSTTPASEADEAANLDNTREAPPEDETVEEAASPPAPSADGGAHLVVLVQVGAGERPEMLLSGSVEVSALAVKGGPKARDHTFEFASDDASNTSIALRASRPALADGSSFAASVVVRVVLEPMAAAFQSGTKGLRTALKHCSGSGSGGALSYGAMPLGDLYRHCCYFNAVVAGVEAGDSPVRPGAPLWPPAMFAKAPKKFINTSVAKVLDSGVGLSAPQLSTTTALGRVRPRWALLKSLDLSSAIIGDRNLPAVLAVVGHCTGLESFSADRSGLSLESAVPIVNVFGQHPTLREVSLCSNDFFESAGDELLRTIKINRRIVAFDLDGNAISDALVRRFAAQLRRNAEELLANIFNPEASVFAGTSIASPEELPAGAWELSLAIWRTLIAAPTPPPESVTGVETSRSTLSDGMVPTCLAAPVFVAVATRAFRSLAPALSDPILRQLVAPLVELEADAGGDGPASILEADAQQVASDIARAQAEADTASIATATSDASNEQAVVPPGHSADAGERVVAGSAAAAETSPIGEYLYPLSFAKILVSAMGTMISFPHRWPYAARALKCLGRAHERLGVTRLFYTTYNEVLFHAVMHELGPDMMHARMQGAWLQTSSFVLRTLLAGRSDTMHVPAAPKTTQPPASA